MSSDVVISTDFIDGIISALLTQIGVLQDGMVRLQSELRSERSNSERLVDAVEKSQAQLGECESLRGRIADATLSLARAAGVAWQDAPIPDILADVKEAVSKLLFRETSHHTLTVSRRLHEDRYCGVCNKSVLGIGDQVMSVGEHNRPVQATMRRVLVEVDAERRHQDEKWGATHDDEHTPAGWVDLIRERTSEANQADFVGKSGEYRGRLIQIAALAVAAAEAYDRHAWSVKSTDADKPADN